MRLACPVSSPQEVHTLTPLTPSVECNVNDEYTSFSVLPSARMPLFYFIYCRPFQSKRRRTTKSSSLPPPPPPSRLVSEIDRDPSTVSRIRFLRPSRLHPSASGSGTYTHPDQLDRCHPTPKMLLPRGRPPREEIPIPPPVRATPLFVAQFFGRLMGLAGIPGLPPPPRPHSSREKKIGADCSRRCL